MIDEERVLRVAIDSAEQDARDDRMERVWKFTLMSALVLVTIAVPGSLFAWEIGLIWIVWLYAVLLILALVVVIASRLLLHQQRAERVARHELLAKLYGR